MHAAPPVGPPGAPPVAIERRRPDVEGSLRAIASIFALQDMIMLAYLTITALMVWWAPPGPLQPGCARAIYGAMAALSIGCLVSRGLVGLPVRLRAALYRVALVGVLLANYLTLRDFLYFIRSDSVDEALVRLDLRLFGVEPALWLERFNQRPIVEWFSFFYFSYFAIGVVYMLGVLWLSRPSRRTAEFAIGTLMVFAIGQLGYTAVPGFGPVGYLKDQFHGPVAGGFWWSCVWGTVQAGGAMKDIFPSLHTAVPFWFTLYALHQARTDRRWRWPARVTGFFSANIIVSTMLLRWHYGVDVLAGLLLASTAALVSPRLAALEEAWRRSQGFPGPWCFDDAEWVGASARLEGER
jgi:membrane-associated phospholipid phosphatase